MTSSAEQVRVMIIIDTGTHYVVPPDFRPDWPALVLEAGSAAHQLYEELERTLGPAAGGDRLSLQETAQLEWIRGEIRAVRAGGGAVEGDSLFEQMKSAGVSGVPSFACNAESD